MLPRIVSVEYLRGFTFLEDLLGHFATLDFARWSCSLNHCILNCKSCFINILVCLLLGRQYHPFVWGWPRLLAETFFLPNFSQWQYFRQFYLHEQYLRTLCKTCNKFCISSRLKYNKIPITYIHTKFALFLHIYLLWHCVIQASQSYGLLYGTRCLKHVSQQ